MSLLECFRLFWSKPLTNLAAESLNEQPAAHADATVDTPDAQRKSHFFQRLMPREHMLVDAVDERAV